MLKFAYKHIPNEWAASFECGSGIQLGCFSAYRALSGARADPHEGMQVNAFGENGDLQLGPGRYSGIRTIRISKWR